MHKNLYKFFKKRNKCDVTNKSTITKRTISEKKVVETIRKSTKRETKLERKYCPFLLQTTWKEKGGNEVIRNFYEIKMKEEWQEQMKG